MTISPAPNSTRAYISNFLKTNNAKYTFGIAALLLLVSVSVQHYYSNIQKLPSLEVDEIHQAQIFIIQLVQFLKECEIPNKDVEEKNKILKNLNKDLIRAYKILLPDASSQFNLEFSLASIKNNKLVIEDARLLLHAVCSMELPNWQLISFLIRTCPISTGNVIYEVREKNLRYNALDLLQNNSNTKVELLNQYLLLQMESLIPEHNTVQTFIVHPFPSKLLKIALDNLALQYTDRDIIIDYSNSDRAVITIQLH